MAHDTPIDDDAEAVQRQESKPAARRRSSIASRVAAGARGLKAAGETIRGVDIGPDGVIRILTGAHDVDVGMLPGRRNPLDRVLTAG
jgi:hypothetical protein